MLGGQNDALALLLTVVMQGEEFCLTRFGVGERLVVFFRLGGIVFIRNSRFKTGDLGVCLVKLGFGFIGGGNRFVVQR